MAINLDAMKQDTVDILADGWGEDLIVKRPSSIYDDNTGMPTEELTVIGTYSGDWQPVRGKVQQEEVGLAIKSDAQVIFPITAKVEENDQVYRADESFMWVNYVKTYEDHITVFLTKTKKG